jgi:protein required for attachment to host cells
MARHGKITWIVIADAAQARIIAQDGYNQPLRVIEQREHAASRRHTSEIASDGRGRGFESAGEGRYAMEAPTDPQEHEKTVFTKEIADLLNDAAKTNRYEQLVIAAPARMLGELRKDLGKSAAEKVVLELDKNIATVPLHDLPALFEDVITVPDPRGR